MQETANKNKRIERSKTIKNRDIPLLSSIYSIMQEIESLEYRGDRRYKMMFSTTQTISGMPGGGQPKGLDDYMAQADDLFEKMDVQIAVYYKQLKQAQDILNAIESVNMRAFVRRQYVDQLDKRIIMRDLNMSEWAYRQARESVEQAQDMAHVIWHDRYIVESGAKENKNPS